MGFDVLPSSLERLDPMDGGDFHQQIGPDGWWRLSPAADDVRRKVDGVYTGRVNTKESI